VSDAAREIRSRLVDARAVIDSLGLEEGARRQSRGVMIRCPWHIERSASCSVTVGADGTLRVHCFGCGATGDVLHLVAAARGLKLEQDFARVLEEAAALAGIQSPEPVSKPRPAPTAQSYPPPDGVQALWSASLPLNRTLVHPDPRELAVAFFCARRAWWPPAVAELDIVRVTPLPDAFAWPRWWPKTWASSWRLITRAYRADGRVASLHARAVDESMPKTRWPYDRLSAGLFFANAHGAALLSTPTEAAVERVLVVEGLTDTVASALEAQDRSRAIAVLGLSSGSTSALSAIRWPYGIPVIVATHDDEAGRRYAADVQRALPSARRVVL
jgi:DNA primase